MGKRACAPLAHTDHLMWQLTAMSLTACPATSKGCASHGSPTIGSAPGLVAVGDYVDGPYPATLEGAVRAGLAAAHALHRHAA